MSNKEIYKNLAELINQSQYSVDSHPKLIDECIQLFKEVLIKIL
jgi:hypothetical protein